METVEKTQTGSGVAGTGGSIRLLGLCEEGDVGGAVVGQKLDKSEQGLGAP